MNTADRAFIYDLLKMDEYIDLIIPRGGEALIRSVVEQSRIPVLKHYKGVCHTFVDDHAEPEMAFQICAQRKVQKPATCNAMETLLVHEAIAPEFLPAIAPFEETGRCPEGMSKRQGKSLRVLKRPRKKTGMRNISILLAVKVVKDMDEAIAHIRKYGSSHTDAIVT